MRKMNWNLLFLKLSTPKNQILLWESLIIFYWSFIIIYLFIMDLTDFNCNYLNKLLQNISKEQKSIFLLGDFNVNLLKYNEHNQKNEFSNSLADIN